jgi:UDP-N-acetyl-D-mannosaminuronic acid dehydrogenase
VSYNCISVVGLGYIGLPTAAVIASNNKKVIGVDLNQDTVDIINAGNVHIVEPDLEIMVKDAVKSGYLKAVTSPEPADAFLIAVPTPFIKTNSDVSVPIPDTSYIEASTRAVAKLLKKGNIVILESTSPVGTTEKMAAWLAQERHDLTFPQTHGSSSDIRIAYCPERVLPGNVINELIQNDRVIGGMTEKCSEVALEIYSAFVKGTSVITDARTAEMTKLTENASRDVGIAFANELSIICDDLDIDVWELISLANRHPRVDILQPGPGVGGHCIAVDPWFIVSKNPDIAQLIHTARKVNDTKPDWVIGKVKIAIVDFLQENPDRTIKDVIIACYGLAFKPNIDDLRESPALDIAQRLANLHHGNTLGIEPNISKLPKNVQNIELVNFKFAIEKADIHILLVDHKEFKSKNLNIQYLVDTKGLWK